MNREHIFPIVILSLVLIFALLFFIIPNALLLLMSFNPLEYNDEELNYLAKIINHFKVIFQPFYLNIYLRSILVGVGTLLLTLIIGYPFACAVYFVKNEYVQRLVLVSIIVPFWTSSLIRTYCITALLRTNGVINKFFIFSGIIERPLDLLYNLTSVIIGFIYTLTPFMVLPIYLSLAKIHKTIIEAARDLGASNLDIFKSILLPLSSDGIISGSSIVFLSSLSMFYLSDILGGGKYILVSNLIKNKFLVTNNLSLGCGICLLFYILVVFVLFLQRKTLSLKLYNN